MAAIHGAQSYYHAIRSKDTLREYEGLFFSNYKSRINYRNIIIAFEEGPQIQVASEWYSLTNDIWN